MDIKYPIQETFSPHMYYFHGQSVCGSSLPFTNLSEPFTLFKGLSRQSSQAGYFAQVTPSSVMCSQLFGFSELFSVLRSAISCFSRHAFMASSLFMYSQFHETHPYRVTLTHKSQGLSSSTNVLPISVSFLSDTSVPYRTALSVRVLSVCLVMTKCHHHNRSYLTPIRLP